LAWGPGWALVLVLAGASVRASVWGWPWVVGLVLGSLAVSGSQWIAVLEWA
jgi:hypothetical protein